MNIKPIAFIANDFTDKFAIPRQSGLTDMLSEIIFEKAYASPTAVRGLEGYSHIWLIWGFHQNSPASTSLTVRPPRLGGNERVGVFASRSPFRPNGLGLSCVKLEKIEAGKLIVSGADLMHATPIYDIKPYIKYSDCMPDAVSGFTETTVFPTLEVIFSEAAQHILPPQQKNILKQLLAQDPRPAYQNEPGRIYGFQFAAYEIKFTVEGNTLCVEHIESCKQKH